eukprot:jgi/Psemu1/27151/gm1.27151_g
MVSIVKTHQTGASKILPRGKTCLFANYSKDHSGDCYTTIFYPKARTFLKSRDVLWLDRMYYSKRKEEEDSIIIEGMRLDKKQEGPMEGEDNREQESLASGSTREELIPPEELIPLEESEKDLLEEEDEDEEPEGPIGTFRSGRVLRSTKAALDGTQHQHYGLSLFIDEELAAISSEIEDNYLEETAELGEEEYNLLNTDKLEEAFVGASGHKYGSTKELLTMNFKEAMATVDKEEWEKAVKYQHVFNVVDKKDLPPQTKLFDSTWAMKKKASGVYQARNAIREFMQIDGGKHFDGQDKSSLVVTEVTIKVVFVLTIVGGWFLKHKKYYPSWAVLQLMKTQYGTALAFMKFERNKAEPCVFFKWEEEYLAVFLLWVNDCCVPRSKKLDEGELKEYVGCQVKQTDKGITLTQPVKIQRFQDEFGAIGDGGPHKRPPKTPAEPGSVLESNKETEERQCKFRFYTRVGILLHMMRWSRPDMLNAYIVITVINRSTIQKKSGLTWLKTKEIWTDFLLWNPSIMRQNATNDGDCSPEGLWSTTNEESKYIKVIVMTTTTRIQYKRGLVCSKVKEIRMVEVEQIMQDMTITNQGADPILLIDTYQPQKEGTDFSRYQGDKASFGDLDQGQMNNNNNNNNTVYSPPITTGYGKKKTKKEYRSNFLPALLSHISQSKSCVSYYKESLGVDDFASSIFIRKLKKQEDASSEKLGQTKNPNDPLSSGLVPEVLKNQVMYDPSVKPIERALIGQELVNNVDDNDSVSDDNYFSPNNDNDEEVIDKEGSSMAVDDSPPDLNTAIMTPSAGRHVFNEVKVKIKLMKTMLNYSMPSVAEKELYEWAIKSERLNLFSWTKGNHMQTRSRVMKDIYIIFLSCPKSICADVAGCKQIYVLSFRKALHSLLMNVTLVKGENLSFPHAEDPTLPSCKTNCNEILAHIILYMDGIAINNSSSGQTTLTPLNMTLGIFNTLAQNSWPDAWETIYFHPTGTHDKGDKLINNVNNLHSGLCLALPSLLKDAFAYFIGNTPQHDQLCVPISIKSGNMKVSSKNKNGEEYDSVCLWKMSDFTAPTVDEGVNLLGKRDRIASYYGAAVHRLSNHDFPQTNFLESIHTAKKEGKQYIGMLYIQKLALLSTEGCQLLLSQRTMTTIENRIRKCEEEIDRHFYTIELLLGTEEFLE